ncbi:MAG: hypothetical protein K2W95_22365 [Candidatus Obscuribacterales bacterium]|nr:hypothetical protein [Candidatus Obscuribacterales bacterium]
MSDRLTVSPELLTTNNDRGPVVEASRAFLHSLVQSPANGLAQIVDKVAGSNILPSIQLIDAPKEQEFFSRNWHAQQIGQAAGMIPWFVGLHKGGSHLLSRAAGLEVNAAVAAMEARTAGTVALGEARLGRSATRFLSAKTGVEVAAAGLSGFTYGAALTATKPDEDFFSSRLKNAANSTATFMTLAASARGLEASGLRNQTLAGVLSGVPAGVVSAESHSLLAGKGFASGSDVAKSVYGFSIIGGGFGYMQGRAEARAEATTQKAKEQPLVRAARSEVSGPGDTVVAPKPEVRGPVSDPAPVLVEAAVVQPDFTLIADLRTELAGGGAPRGPRDLLAGSEAVYKTDGPGRELVAIRRRGETHATSCQRTGIVVLEVPGKPWVAELPHGQRITPETPGPWEVVTPSGRVVHKNAEGTTVIRDWEGKELHIIENPLAPVERRLSASRANGDRYTLMNDGTRVEQPKSGAPWEAIRPDGSKFQQGSPGPWEAILPDGTHYMKDAQSNLHQKNQYGQVTRSWFRDGSRSEVRHTGEGLEYTEVTKPQAPVERHYSDPAVPGQRVTEIGTIAVGDRINGGSFDWKAVGSDGKPFTYDSPGPWQVTLLDGAKLSKDVAGNIKHVSSRSAAK